jgi:hypothetical protein
MLLLLFSQISVIFVFHSGASFSRKENAENILLQHPSRHPFFFLTGRVSKKKGANIKHNFIGQSRH